MADFASRLHALRIEKHISQKKLAKELLVNSASVGAWEKGRYLPMRGRICRVAEYFGVTEEYMIGESDIREPVSDEAVIRNTQYLMMVRQFQDLPGDQQQLVRLMVSNMHEIAKNHRKLRSQH